MPHEIDAPVLLGAFAAPPLDLAAVLRAPALARLSELGAIRVDGADAITFLQSQLTNDVAHLGPEALQLNGYCTPKGRLLATFHQWRDGDAFVLQLPRELVAPVAKRLSMFVLRAKARLADISERQATYALLGPQSSAALQSAGINPPSQAWACAVSAGVRVSRLPAAPRVAERFLRDARRRSDICPRRSRRCRSWQALPGGGARWPPRCRPSSRPRRRGSCRR